MYKSSKLLQKRKKLKKRYLRLMEDAYNFRQTDHALSDLSEFKAVRLLNRLNKLKFLERDTTNLV